MCLWLFSEESIAREARPPSPASAIPLEDFFREPQFSQVKLSPNGRYLGVVLPVKGRRNLAIIDLSESRSEARRASVITSLKEGDVDAFQWVNDDRLVFYVFDSQADLDGQRNSGFYAINRDATELRDLGSSFNQRLSSFPGAGSGRASWIRAVLRPPSGDDILVGSTVDNRKYPDVFRVDTKTLARTKLSETRPGDVTSWVLDKQNRVRLASTIDEGGKRSLWHRGAEGGPWRRLYQTELYGKPADAIAPIAFDYDGTLYVAAHGERDKASIYAYDLTAGKLGERIASHADYDLNGGLIFDQKWRKLVGLRIEAEQPEFVWFDKDWATWHKMLDQSLPGHVNVMSRSGDDSRLLVHSYSDRDPGTWYLFDPVNRTLQQVAAARPWIKPEQMSERRFIRYTARDGLSIPAYLTLPRQREPKGLPLVVLVHGGPFVRGESWQWDAEAQFLASRGYAVLQADFRGSQGYGLKHYRAGWKQWGLAMQDDLNDGLEYLAKQGIVDPKRACIMGASYGGYAAMIGLARDPDLWRCGINIVGVTDLDLMTTATWSDTNQYYEEVDHVYETRVGLASKEPERFNKTSPLRQAAKIKAPVLMAYGGADYRVVPEHGTRMKRALENNGIAVEFLWFPGEGHGFVLEENNLELYRQIERFLAKNLGN